MAAKPEGLPSSIPMQQAAVTLITVAAATVASNNIMVAAVTHITAAADIPIPAAVAGFKEDPRDP